MLLKRGQDRNHLQTGCRGCWKPFARSKTKAKRSGGLVQAACQTRTRPGIDRCFDGNVSAMRFGQAEAPQASLPSWRRDNRRRSVPAGPKCNQPALRHRRPSPSRRFASGPSLSLREREFQTKRPPVSDAAGGWPRAGAEHNPGPRVRRFFHSSPRWFLKCASRRSSSRSSRLRGSSFSLPSR